MEGKFLYPGIAYFVLAKDMPSAKAGSIVDICDADGRSCLLLNDETEEGTITGERIEFGIGYAKRYPEWFMPVTDEERLTKCKENDIQYLMSKGKTREQAELLEKKFND
jgi:hypothetical protein